MAKRRKFPAFIPIHVEGEGTAYMSVSDVLNDADTSSQITDYALAELERWDSHWGDLMQVIHEKHPAKITACVSDIVTHYRKLKRANRQNWPIVEDTNDD